MSSSSQVAHVCQMEQVFTCVQLTIYHVVRISGSLSRVLSSGSKRNNPVVSDIAEFR